MSSVSIEFREVSEFRFLPRDAGFLSPKTIASQFDVDRRALGGKVIMTGPGQQPDISLAHRHSVHVWCDDRCSGSICLCATCSCATLASHGAGNCPFVRVSGVRRGEKRRVRRTTFNDAKHGDRPTMVFVVGAVAVSDIWPRLPYADYGACPFEGCTYRAWSVLADTVLLAARRDSAAVVLRCEVVRRFRLTGVVVLAKIGRTVV